MHAEVFFPSLLRHAGLAGAVWLASTGAVAQMGPGLLTDDWRFSLGAGVASRPLYPGSAERTVSAVPMIGANYGRYFIGGVPGAGVPTGIGAYLVHDDTWKLGVALGGNLSSPRKESDSPLLQGMGDIDATALAAVFGSYSYKWIGARLGVVTDIAGHDQGTRVGLDVDFRYKVTDQLFLSAGPGLTWADGTYTQTFFGVTPAQSIASGYPVYKAGSGINMIRFNLGANYQLTPQWGAAARASLASLRGDAEDSPITEKKAQNTIGLFVNYQF